jgi:SAM-dependent methyltransferase
MASYKSQFLPPRRMEDRAPTTRLPQRSITPTTITTITAERPTTSHSKLQKRRPSRDELPSTSRAPASQKAPVRKAAPLPRTGSSIASKPQQQSIPASRTAPQVQTTRLPKLEVPANIRTPSLASGSSASTIESPRSNVLRRKQTSVGVAGSRQALRVRDDSMSSQDESQPMGGIPGGYKDPFSETVLGISLPPSSTLYTRSDPEVDPFDRGLYNYDIGSTDILPLPTPQYALSATPSTRYSGSPGPFSVSSTPTSMSSYSPGTALSRNSHRTKQASPLQSRPPVARHRTPDEPSVRNPHTLSTVRESSTSSSSASTVVTDGAKPRDKQSTNGLIALPQSPPLNSEPAPAERACIQAPPEFAHLVDQSPVSVPVMRRPARPSRDGTPELMGIRGPSPVVQSNMMAFPSTHRRTSSTESKTGLGPAARSRAGVPTKVSSRIPSPGPSSSRGPSRGPTPEIQSDRDARRSSTLPAPVPAPSPSKSSRFGFFSRRTKTDPIPTPKTENKLQRKGPVAGTGHEGYGKYSVRGRSGSSISAASIGRSASAGTTSESLDRTPSTRKSSMTSTASTDMDDFFLNRLAPRVIRGTGNSTELSRSPEPMHSSSSLDVSSRSGYELKKTNTNTSQNAVERKPTLLPSAMPDTLRGQSPRKKTPLGRRRPSESDDDSKRSFLPALASRRTSRAIKTPDATGKQSLEKGRKESVGDITSEGKEGRWLKSSKKSKVEKEQPKTSKKWNFFQRAHAAPRADTPAVAHTAHTTAVPISRSVAHYALLDQSGLDMNDIEELMKEANTADEGTESALSDDEPERRERMQSMLLPPKPILPPSTMAPIRSASPKVTLRKPMQQEERQPQKLFLNTNIQYAPRPSARQSLIDLTPMDLSPPSSPFSPPSPPQERVVSSQIAATPAPAPAPVPAPMIPAPVQGAPVSPQSLPPPGPPPTSPPPRPSRLPQVGRIPQVISTRRPPRRPSSQSFSRPFIADQPRPAAVPRTSFDSIGSMVATAGPVEPFPILRGLNALTHGSAIATISPLSDESRRSEFFKFPPRKDSEVSYSSSSGIWSFAPAFGTAVVPGPGAPLSEDELWNEYDDLLDEVLSPVSSRTSHDRTLVRSQHPSLEPLPLKTKAARESSQSNCSAKEVLYPSLHLRRSRLLAVLHSTQSPTSEVSFNDFLQDYGERKISVVDPVTGRLSLPSSPRLSTGSATKRSTRSSLPANLPLSARQSKATIASRSSKDRDSAAANRYRDSRLMEIAETQADGLVSMANLRFGALMTSKWLSFGRVLFSPVHFDLKDPSDDRVLVIDGLGKDWSYYCALTYPEATVYDVGPGMSSTTPNDGAAEPWSTLSNHRHICHDSLMNALPFPMHFFACVVLRFPTALPSSVHRFVLAEAKRVLRPGGYLEFSVLDLDLVNMGNRARRAVRGLKMRMQVADETLSLRNISDEIMAGIGRKGFVECNRCVVGVPVAGKLPSLDDAKASAAKRTGSNASSKSKKTSNLTAKGPKPEVSFSDLLNASQPSESTDNGITDMVARVGRWWYSRCYESLVLPEAGEPGAEASGNLLENSIWRDEALINECEKRGTSFKMLIGYAQKPEIGVRRTVSI